MATKTRMAQELRRSSTILTAYGLRLLVCYNKVVIIHPETCQVSLILAEKFFSFDYIESLK